MNRSLARFKERMQLLFVGKRVIQCVFWPGNKEGVFYFIKSNTENSHCPSRTSITWHASFVSLAKPFIFMFHPLSLIIAFSLFRFARTSPFEPHILFFCLLWFVFIYLHLYLFRSTFCVFCALPVFLAKLSHNPLILRVSIYFSYLV